MLCSTAPGRASRTEVTPKRNLLNSEKIPRFGQPTRNIVTTHFPQERVTMGRTVTPYPTPVQHNCNTSNQGCRLLYSQGPGRPIGRSGFWGTLHDRKTSSAGGKSRPQQQTLQIVKKWRQTPIRLRRRHDGKAARGKNQKLQLGREDRCDCRALTGKKDRADRAGRRRGQGLHRSSGKQALRRKERGCAKGPTSAGDRGRRSIERASLSYCRK